MGIFRGCNIPVLLFFLYDRVNSPVILLPTGPLHAIGELGNRTRGMMHAGSMDIVTAAGCCMPRNLVLRSFMNSSDLLIIRGYVQALPVLSGRDEMSKVAVITEDGTEYRILHKGAGTSLISNINANVEVTGMLTGLPVTPSDGDEERGNLLTVKRHPLTDGFDDPWYDDAVG